MEGQNERKGYPVTAAGYELLEEIGQGVSATVYRALCMPFNEVVAIKSLDLEKCISNLDGIRREAQMMSLISHPNVVKAYCSFVVEQTLWVVMPYMAGGSCLHIMKSAHPDGFDEPVIATVLKAALKALEYLHRHGHIHRDVKAGNILVDEKGVIKLGDFGVSACMFDTGDRQRSRNTFVGTPCWMAPEVMEQLHGYDFKADIWSFGITGLELAHGHAPFSKYPPMKVLLMTLQNAPPGLDYERDKKFSKLFKEMIAMCLVKDPAKRPSAEKLLKHSFFKHARNYEYIARHVLEGLPSLGERVTTLKLKDAVRLAQKKMPSGEWEERSQNEYKRGVSSWNFNVEDLKAQADMIEDDDGSAPGVKEDNEVFKVRNRKEDNEVSKVREGTESEVGTTDVFPPVNAPLSSDIRNLERSELSSTAPSSKGNTTAPPSKGNTTAPLSKGNTTSPPSKGDATSGAGERVSRISRSESMASPLRRTNNAPIRSSSIGKRELKHLARFNIFGSASDLTESVNPQAQDLGDERQTVRRDDGAPGRGAADRDGGTDKPQTGSEERESRQGVRASEDLTRTKSQFWERGTVSAPVSAIGSKEALDEKPKAGIIQKKGRFSVTSEVVGSDTSTEKEREHLQQITELQTKVASLVDELQAVKLRNAELERQLSSTPMDERIHRK